MKQGETFQCGASVMLCPKIPNTLSLCKYPNVVGKVCTFLDTEAYYDFPSAAMVDLQSYPTMVSLVWIHAPSVLKFNFMLQQGLLAMCLIPGPLGAIAENLSDNIRKVQDMNSPKWKPFLHEILGQPS